MMTNIQNNTVNDEVIFADADWHVKWRYNNHPSKEVDCLAYLRVGYLYAEDSVNDLSYSVLRMSDAEILMTKLRNGEKMSILRFFHFADAHIEQVNEILRSDFLHGVERFEPDPFFIPFIQLTELGNEEIARAIADELLNRGWNIQSAATKFLNSVVYANDDEYTGKVMEFVRKCETRYLYDRLNSKLSTNGGSKKSALMKI